MTAVGLCCLERMIDCVNQLYLYNNYYYAGLQLITNFM